MKTHGSLLLCNSSRATDLNLNASIDCVPLIKLWKCWQRLASRGMWLPVFFFNNFPFLILPTVASKNYICVANRHTFSTTLMPLTSQRRGPNCA